MSCYIILEQFIDYLYDYIISQIIIISLLRLTSTTPTFTYAYTLPIFQNTVNGVVYQKSNGYYAFTTVKNGTINQAADAASKKAVNEALAFRGQGKGSLFFYNPKTAVSKWIFSREVTVTIGNHRFAK